MPQSDPISLSALQSLIKQGIDRAHPLPYWVAAEISELKVNYSGHCYLELVEKGGANHIPKAKVSAVIWRNTYAMLEPYFRQTTGQGLVAGLQVLVKVVVSYHELYGLSLQITDIDPAYTLGDMERQRQETIAQLRADGIFDMNRELEIPIVVQRLAVVSSRNAAGYQDFCNELSSGEFSFEVTLFDAFMQGAGAEESIIEALDHVADRADAFDAVVLIRGGGSQSDLGCFDSYRLCSHVAQFPLPVIAGIGHDKDQSVADLVAAVSLKTPTAVAVYLKNEIGSFDAWLEGVMGELSESALTLLDERLQQVRQMAVSLKIVSSEQMHDQELTLSRLHGDLLRVAGQAFHQGRSDLHMLTVQLAQASRYGLESAGQSLSSLRTALAQRSGEYLRSRTQELAWMGDLVGTRDPQRILEMGFAMIQIEGKSITRIEDLHPGDTVSVVLRDGSAEAEIHNLHPKKKK